MRLLIPFVLMTFSAALFAKDAPCQVDLYKSQGQLSKATSTPLDQDLKRILSSRLVTLPELQAKVAAVESKAKTSKVANKNTENQWETEVSERPDSPQETPSSKLGNMFELLIPAKLRNPAR